jgi:hypothetical protein
VGAKPSGLTVIIVALVGLWNILAGLMHLAAADGAAAWAGLPPEALGTGPGAVWLFAAFGAALIALGVGELAAATSFPPMVRLFLFVELARALALTLVQYQLKPVLLEGPVALVPLFLVILLTVAAIVEVRRI